jgi:hypothetical protein
VSLRLRLLRRGLTASMRLSLLDELAAVTAAGFGSSPPQWQGATFEERLREYARFTAGRAETLLAQDDPAALAAAQARLRAGAEGLGAKARRSLGLSSTSDALDALAVLYQEIGIEMSRVAPGDVVVTRCLFAERFSEPVCRVVGALDDGMAAGLAGGGRLDFGERLTAGAACCRAHFDPAGLDPASGR